LLWQGIFDVYCRWSAGDFGQSKVDRPRLIRGLMGWFGDAAPYQVWSRCARWRFRQVEVKGGLARLLRRLMAGSFGDAAPCEA
jgi:hypothetical protein